MDVHDSRTVVDFQKFTFSGHLRSHVLKVLDENVKLGNADYACYWALEMVCSGLVHSLWTQFFESAAKHIHRAAPNVFLYLVQKYEKFATYEGQYSLLQMTNIRNNPDVRIMICEVAASLALCRKQKPLSLPKIKVEHDFQPLTVQEHLKAPSSSYARHIAAGEDPLDLYVPLNEFVFCLRPETRDAINAFYWYAWIMKFVSQKKKEKVEIVCAHRPNSFVDDKFGRHPIWLLWTAILDAAKQSPQAGLLNPYMDSLFKLYCLRWTPASMKQRNVFIMSAITFVCESATLDIHTPVPHDIHTIQNVTANIPQWILAIIQTKKTFSS
jgi:hypothetical protein